MARHANPSDAGDPFDLGRFLSAQRGTHDQALAELEGGRKRTHWMWFVFPQIDGLGRSPTARRYAITGLAEARAYLDHPVLGPRLRACAQALLSVEGRSASEIMGYPDDLKLRSSMTLFARVAEEDSVFDRVLRRYYHGEADAKTLEVLEGLGEA